MTDKSIYNYKVQALNGEEIDLASYKNKVLLIVNTASQCGFAPQLDALEKLRKEFAQEDFNILTFPSNDFRGQEPLSGNQLEEFCSINYQTHFAIFDKIHVKGPDAHSLYRFLSSKKLNGNVNSSPKWNFHKYLINRKGEVVDFFYTFTKPDAARVKKKIRKLLSE